MDEEKTSFVKCPSCANDVPASKFCPYCGAKLHKGTLEIAHTNEAIEAELSNKEQDEQQANGSSTTESDTISSISTITAPVVAMPVTSAAPQVSTLPSSQEATAEKNPYKTALIVLLVIALCVFLLVVFAFATAEKRTVIDVASYERGTGVYNVINDRDNSPCYVGQDWTDCINAHVDEYNASCANRKLTSNASTLCEKYSNMIDEMKEKDRGWTYVSSLGTWGYLSVEEITETVPAETHEAVCYLGFIGECAKK